MKNSKTSSISTFSLWIIILGYLYLITGVPLQVWGNSDFILSKKYSTTEAAIVGLILGIVFGLSLLFIGYSLKNISSGQMKKVKKLIYSLIFVLLVIGVYWISDFALISLINLVFIVIAIIKYRQLKTS